ncbi:glycosyltransferase [Flavobacterium sp. T12S277]|uniref:glycosyltransferase n=1 Tax=Flavobacterium sp. T12S277 TaxID=3402752 RepID=UPI003AECD985
MSKIKIAHILHSVGGVDVSLRQILQNINTLEFESIVIHGDSDTQALFQDKNFESIVEFKVPIHREISIKNDFLAIRKALKIIRKERPDLIHSHSTKGGVIARVIGFLTGIKVLHTPQAFSYLCTDKKIKKTAFLLIEKLLSKGNSVLLASSESELQRAIEEVGYARSKTALFNNAITPIDKVFRLSIPKTWPDKYLCSVGRPCYQKNTEELIRVLYEVNKTEDIHLVLVGVGHHADQLEMVENLVLKLNLKDKITILNWTSREDVLHITSKSKLYVSTSRYEGLPYAIIESLALSIPNVVSDCDGNRDLIKNDFNGFCIKNNDTKEFSQKIIKLLREESLHNEFSRNAKDTFLKHHNIGQKIKDLESIYKKELE